MALNGRFDVIPGSVCTLRVVLENSDKEPRAPVSGVPPVLLMFRSPRSSLSRKRTEPRAGCYWRRRHPHHVDAAWGFMWPSSKDREDWKGCKREGSGGGVSRSVISVSCWRRADISLTFNRSHMCGGVVGGGWRHRCDYIYTCRRTF